MAMEAVAMEMGEMRMVSAPGYGRLFPRRSTKPVKEDSAAVGAFFDDIVVTKLPEAERKMAVAGPGAGNKAAAAAGGGIVKAASWSDMEILEAGAGNKIAVPAPVPPLFPAGAGKKTKVVPVSDEDLKSLEARGPVRPSTCRPEEVRLWPADSLEEREMWDSFAEMLEGRQALRDHETAILEQYRKYGYAYKMIVVDDVDDKV